MIGTRRVLFVGNDQLILEIGSRISRRMELGFGICGYLDAGGSGESGAALPIGPCLGSYEELAPVAERVRPDRIVVGSRAGDGLSADLATLLKLVRSGVVIEDARTTYESICGRVSLRELKASPIIFRNELAARPGSVALQSIYANLAGICGFGAALPVLIICAIAIKLNSRGPILEPEIRVGQHGIPFSLKKFRCCRLAKDGPSDSLAGRLTGVGKWLQRLHLVNLPQIVNLLRGEMTLVGPRPESPEFVEELSKYFAYYRQRHTVKPGMTGWSQINSPRTSEDLDSLSQLEYDLYYTKHISLALDAYILLHGVRRLLPFA
jgi:lipopolysaccharide/colanic/teichoic acid biosynthesis glycosyltransferase